MAEAETFPVATGEYGSPAPLLTPAGRLGARAAFAPPVASGYSVGMASKQSRQLATPGRSRSRDAVASFHATPLPAPEQKHVRH